MAYRFVWIAGGPDPLCTPTDIDYYDQAFADVTPSHGDYNDAHILTDEDTSTWVDFNSDIFAGDADFHDQVAVDFSPAAELNPGPSSELAVYYRADQDMRIRLRPDPAVASFAYADAVIGQTTSTPAEIGGDWRRAPLVFADSWTHQNVASAFTSVFGWRIEVLPPEAPDDTQTMRDYLSRIIEVRVAYMTFVPGAPPCRLFPRSDGLGVGGGRHYPPAKSQQRSARRFGYY